MASQYFISILLLLKSHVNQIFRYLEFLLYVSHFIYAIAHMYLYIVVLQEAEEDGVFAVLSVINAENPVSAFREMHLLIRIRI